MKEEDLENIIKLKYDYEKADRFTKQWLDFVYNENRIKNSDDYYDIDIDIDYKTKEELTIHLPTIIRAMEKYRDELYEKYQKKLKEV